MPRKKGAIINSGMAKTPKGKGLKTIDSLLDYGSDCSACRCNECYGYYTIVDYNSTTGEETVKAFYMVDGAFKIDTIANAKSELDTYKSYDDNSPTSVTISSCPVGNVTHPDTVQLSATVSPAGSNQSGSWTSSNEAAATVDNTGLVTTVAAGTTTITFTSDDGGLTDTCDITVV